MVLEGGLWGAGGLVYAGPMSYVTLEAQIDHGKLVVKEPEKLPPSARALVTILDAAPAGSTLGGPLEALEALQQHLQLDDKQAAEWMATIRQARR